MKKYSYKDLTPEKVSALSKRPKMDFASVFGTVQPILDDVKSDGDAAIQKYTQKFDGVTPDSVTIDPNAISVTLDPARSDRHSYAEYLPLSSRAVFNGA